MQHTIADLEPGKFTGDFSYRNFMMSMRSQGSHLSILQHISRNPESSRNYSPGDPLTRIDWKVFARSDHLIVRQERVEAGAKIAIGIDLSEAMFWPDKEFQNTIKNETELAKTKAEIAMRIACDIAYQLLYLGDQVEFWLYDGSNPEFPGLCRRLRSHNEINLLFHNWQKSHFELASITADFSPKVLNQNEAYQVMFWIGDGLSRAEVQKFWRRGKLKVFCHVLHKLEIDTDWLKKDFCYFDESGRLLEFQGSVLRSDEFYDRNFKNWLEEKYQATVQDSGLYLRMDNSTLVEHFHQSLWKGSHLKA
mgnify:CR=1 FL=1